MASTQLFNSLLSLRVAIQKYGSTQHVCTRHREQLRNSRQRHLPLRPVSGFIRAQSRCHVQV
jgi:hypothetical protein